MPLNLKPVRGALNDMEKRTNHQAYPVPMGGWCLKTGTWTHNPHLKASQDAQHSHNVEFGYIEKGENHDEETVETDSKKLG